METTEITLGTTIGTHVFYSALFKDRAVIRDLLPKIDSTITITNVLNVDEDGTFNDEAYGAMIGLIRLSLRQPDITQEDIEQWLDSRTAKLAIRTLLDLPV